LPLLGRSTSAAIAVRISNFDGFVKSQKTKSCSP
jgi:hypothetical protein